LNSVIFNNKKYVKLVAVQEKSKMMSDKYYQIAKPDDFLFIKVF